MIAPAQLTQQLPLGKRPQATSETAAYANEFKQVFDKNPGCNAEKIHDVLPASPEDDVSSASEESEDSEDPGAELITGFSEILQLSGSATERASAESGRVAVVSGEADGSTASPEGAALLPGLETPAAGEEMPAQQPPVHAPSATPAETTTDRRAEKCPESRSGDMSPKPSDADRGAADRHDGPDSPEVKPEEAAKVRPASGEAGIDAAFPDPDMPEGMHSYPPESRPLSALAGELRAILSRHLSPETLPTPVLMSNGAATDGTVEFVIESAELGRLNFSLREEADTLRVFVSTDRSDTLDLLRRGADRLLEELRAAGYGHANMSFEQAPDRKNTPEPPPVPENDRIAHFHLPSMPSRLIVSGSGLDLRF